MNSYAKVLSVAGVILAVGACDRQDREQTQQPAERAQGTAPMPEPEVAAEETNEEIAKVRGTDEARDAADLVKDAADTLREMKTDENMMKLLNQAKGVFIVPEYGRGAAVVGARGGEGVLVAKEGGKWMGPVFYDIGGISVGAQFGGEGGEIAMVLMSDQALNSFKGDNTFSLNADAKLTIVDFSALSEASLGKSAGDVVFWSDTEGAFAGLTLSATAISWDDEENPAYYGKKATAEDILSGKVSSKMGELEPQLSGM